MSAEYRLDLSLNSNLQELRLDIVLDDHMDFEHWSVPFVLSSVTSYTIKNVTISANLCSLIFSGPDEIDGLVEKLAEKLYSPLDLIFAQPVFANLARVTFPIRVWTPTDDYESTRDLWHKIMQSQLPLLHERKIMQCVCSAVVKHENIDVGPSNTAAP